MYSALSQKRCSSAIHPLFHFAMVDIVILIFLPVGGMDFPSGIFNVWFPTCGLWDGLPERAFQEDGGRAV
jgi:hypothetical protein